MNGNLGFVRKFNLSSFLISSIIKDVYPFAIINYLGSRIEKKFREFAKELNEKILPLLPVPDTIQDEILLDAKSILEVLQELRDRNGQYIDQDELEKVINQNLELIDIWAVSKTNEVLEKSRKVLIDQNIPVDQINRRVPLIPKDDPVRLERIPLASRNQLLLQNKAYAEHFDKVEDIITKGITKRVDPEIITKEILDKVDMNAKRARFWAEDQATLFHAEQRRIGALRGNYTHYRWVAGGSARPSHAVHRGGIYSWNVGVNNLTRPGARHPG
jgi:hypothetical protein